MLGEHNNPVDRQLRITAWYLLQAICIGFMLLQAYYYDWRVFYMVVFVLLWVYARDGLKRTLEEK